MNITLCSAFRNATGYIDRYFDQVEELALLLYKRGDYLSLVLGKGDSTDGTAEALFEAAAGSIGAQIIDCAHGGQHYGSIEHEQRFKQLAHVGNCIWQAIPKDADAVIYVESDLIWQPVTLLALLDTLTVYSAVSPMIMDSPPANTFYDVWAFRRSGQRFSKRPPYHPDIDGSGTMLRLDSAGSCMALRGGLARRLSFPEDCFVGFSRLIYEEGGELFLCPDLTVYHP